MVILIHLKCVVQKNPFSPTAARRRLPPRCPIATPLAGGTTRWGRDGTTRWTSPASSGWRVLLSWCRLREVNLQFLSQNPIRIVFGCIRVTGCRCGVGVYGRGCCNGRWDGTVLRASGGPGGVVAGDVLSNRLRFLSDRAPCANSQYDGLRGGRRGRTVYITSCGHRHECSNGRNAVFADRSVVAGSILSRISTISLRQASADVSMPVQFIALVLMSVAISSICGGNFSSGTYGFLLHKSDLISDPIAFPGCRAVFDFSDVHMGRC